MYVFGADYVKQITQATVSQNTLHVIQQNQTCTISIIQTDFLPSTLTHWQTLLNCPPLKKRTSLCFPLRMPKKTPCTTVDGTTQ